MITILAEKPDVGGKIAAALDKITLASGKEVTFATLKYNEKAVKNQQHDDGFLRIRYNGQDCFVTWGYGHICELKEPEDYNPSFKNWKNRPQPFIPNPYQLKVKKGYEAHFHLIQRMFLKSEYIINATDFDREGEVIFSYIYEMTGSKAPVKRVCFASQTKEGICEAFASLKDWSEVKNTEAAGRMRGIADWVVGINLTTVMTLHNHVKGSSLSLGRVQTPTLKMLVDRELAVRDFRPEKYWTLDATFKTEANESYTATHKTKRFNDKPSVDAIIQKIEGKNGKVTEIVEKKEEKYPPQLYNLSALQMDANVKYGMTLKQTLEAAQALYNAGYTTYPRTDSRYLTEDMVPTVNRVLDSLAHRSNYAALIEGRKRSFTKWRYFDNKKVESHFAIIPTTSTPQRLTEYQAKIYDLICKSVICMLYGKAVLNKTTVTTTVNGEDFISSGSAILEPGFMTVIGKDKENYLPALSQGEVVSGSYEIKEKETEPPKRYTDKTMLAAMISAGKDLEDEELKKILADPSVSGIGTPATRDAIIEKLIKQEYAERNKKTLSATEKGIALIQGLTVESIKSPALTAKWEKRLHEIERGNEEPLQFQTDIEKTVNIWCKAINVSPVMNQTSLIAIPCPVCGKPMKEYSWGYGCGGYREGCSFKIGTICGKKLTHNQLKKLLTTGDSGLISGFKSKAGKSFNAHLLLTKDFKIEFQFEKSKGGKKK